MPGRGIQRLPPFNPGPDPSEPDACRRFDLSDPVSKVGSMVYDERGAVLREDVLKEPVEEYVPVHFPHHLTVIPGRGAYETVIRSLISPVEEIASKRILQAA